MVTRDSIDKVVDWYVEKLNPRKHIKLPGGNAVLQAGDINVVITGSEEGTSIILKQGADR